jgi:hypothetical protein
MRRSITAILLICLFGLVGTGRGPSYGYGYGDLTDRTGVAVGTAADAPSWFIIPGKTTSSGIPRIFTALEEPVTSVVSTAADFMVAVMAVGTGAEGGYPSPVCEAGVYLWEVSAKSKHGSFASSCRSVRGDLELSASEASRRRFLINLR